MESAHNFPSTSASQQAWRMRKRYHLLFLGSCFWLFSPWSRVGHALIVQNLTGEFMRKIYAASGNLFSDSWSWQSFVSPSCHVFNYLFPLDVQNEIHLLSRLFCNSWLVCLFGSWLRNAPFVKIDGIAFVFHLVWCVRGFKRLNRFWPYLMAIGSWISTAKGE